MDGNLEGQGFFILKLRKPLPYSFEANCCSVFITKLGTLLHWWLINITIAAQNVNKTKSKRMTSALRYLKISIVIFLLQESHL